MYLAVMQAPKDEGSPVDVAKSYMRSRPPWSSPSVDHTKPPTLSGIQLFKEETPHIWWQFYVILEGVIRCVIYF